MMRLTLILCLFVAPVSAKADQHATSNDDPATITILALGDSLTAGYGLGPGVSFPEKLQAALASEGHDVRIINAGVSGDTSTSGLARLDWALSDVVDGVIVELGANDALRGIKPEITADNLNAILTILNERNLPTLLAGMKAPPNMGKPYTQAFDAIYPQLADSHDVVFYPFFLDGIAAEPTLNQPDGMHPNEDGVNELVARIMPSVLDLLTRVKAERAQTQ